MDKSLLQDYFANPNLWKKLLSVLAKIPATDRSGAFVQDLAEALIRRFPLLPDMDYLI